MNSFWLFSMLAVFFAIMVYFYLSKRLWYEHFEPLEKIELPGTHNKQNSRLVLHYGLIPLDLEKEAHGVRDFAKQNNCDYCDIHEQDIWKSVNTFFEHHKYEYIMIIPARVFVHRSDPHRFDTLVQQAGDSCMILARDESNLKQVNTDVVIFRRSEWTTYKLHQFYYRKEEVPTAPLPIELVLDQVYTPFVHKTFVDFSDVLNLGIPYMLNLICVYHEHALISKQSDFLRYHEREATKLPKVTIYPWSSIRHPKFVTVKTDDIWNVISNSSENIPKIIFQTMETHLITVHIRACMEQLQQLNPGYKYYYFTAYDCRVFIQKYYPEVLDVYDDLLPGAYKADLWRYCVLHKYGGFYMDSRMYPYLPFESIITKQTEFMSCVDITPNMLYQAILAASPGSVYMRHAIDECVENIKARRNRIGDLAITGPRVMGRALNKSLGRPVTQSLDDVVDKKVALLRWDSTKVPKYIMFQDEIFACHKYTKLLSEKEVNDETALWLTLTGKEHYSVMYRNNRIYKESLFR